MNSNMTRPKNKTEDLLPSKIKNCETLTQQINRRPEGTLDFKPYKTKTNISFQSTYPD